MNLQLVFDYEQEEKRLKRNNFLDINSNLDQSKAKSNLSIQSKTEIKQLARI